MSRTTLGLPPDLHAYLLQVGVREHPALSRLRAETDGLPQAEMQIAPEQGALLALLTELVGARRCLEVGTFTGYSALAVALALPPDGRVLCCDVSEEWTSIARRHWDAAGVGDRVDLRLGPAISTLDDLLAQGETDGYDFAFVDAAKTEYAAYYDRLIRLVRRGGLIAFDNVFQDGAVARPGNDDPDVRAIRDLNAALAADERVSLAMVPVADGLTLARRR